MKKKTLLIIILLFCTLNLTGCTKYLKNDKKEVLKDENTGQSLVQNILCQPTPEDESLIKKYEENGVKINKLPKCSEFKVTSGGYEGIWTTLFVKPLAWVILKVGYLVKNFGLGIILVTLLIRGAMVPLTKKAAMQSENMKKIQPELEKLEKKYNGKTDQNSMMQKSQEMMILYKKNDINLMSGCLFSFIQLPLFMAFYEALYRIPAIFEGKFLIFELGLTPGTAIAAGKWYYLILVVLVFIVTFFSFKLNSGASMSQEQAAQMKMMRNMSIIMLGMASFTVSSAIAFYWITNSSFTILQNLYVKRRSTK